MARPRPRRRPHRPSAAGRLPFPIPYWLLCDPPPNFGHRREPPSCLPPRNASLRTKIKWWEEVLLWLRDMIDAIEESLNKDLDDLSALKRAATKQPSRESYERLTPWGRWQQQQQDLGTCQLKKLFYGPQSLPSNISIPSSDEMVEISAFVESHERYLFKFCEHLEHLLELVGNRVIPQVEYKLEGLRIELEFKELGVWMPQGSFFEGGFAPDQPIIDDLSYPDPEDDSDL